MPKMSTLSQDLALFIVGVALGTQSMSVAEASDWTTYGYDVAHRGDNPNETTLTADNVGKLSLLWSFKAQAGILTQPVFVQAVPNVNGSTRDLVVIGDLDSNVFALDANKGTVQWTWSTQPGYVTRHCPGPPVYDDLPNGRYGMIGTPVVERNTDGGAGRIYLALLGKVYALSLNSGTPAPGWNDSGITVVANPFNPNVSSSDGMGDNLTDSAMQSGIIVYSALTLNAGKLYVPFGGISCDYPDNYYGQLAAVNTSTAQLSQRWYVTNPALPETSGSLWGVSGVSVDPAGGVFVASGNSQKGAVENDQYAEHVVKLNLDLTSVLGSDDPAVGALIQGKDRDFGGNPVLFKPQDCDIPLAAVLNKSGKLLIYARDHLGDRANFPPQSVQIGFSPSASDYAGNLIGAPAWSARLQQLYIANNTDGTSTGGLRGGLLAYRFVGCQLDSTPLWATVPATWQVHLEGEEGGMTPPTTAHDIVYFGTGRSADSQPSVYALDARRQCGPTLTTGCSQDPGRILWQSSAFDVGVFTAPTVVNGVLYVPSMDGVIRAYGLPPLTLYAQVSDELIALIKAGGVGSLRPTLLQYLKSAHQQFLVAAVKHAANKPRAAKFAYRTAVNQFSQFEKVLASKKAHKYISAKKYKLLNDKTDQIRGKLHKSPF